jgi:putative oxidoreductase
MSEITTPRNRLVFPALGGLYARLERYSWPLLRFTAGAMLVPHGALKLFGGMDGLIGWFASMGMPPALAWYVALLEFAGGIMLAAGLLTRLVAAQIVGLRVVIVFMVHWGNGYLWTNGGYEYPLMWALIALAITIRGGGELSVDARLGREI